MAENNDEVVNPDDKLLNETQSETITEPIIEETPEPSVEEYNHVITEIPGLYEVQAADLNAYPELSQQGVQLYDHVAYGSLYVLKKATADGDDIVQQAWPLETGNEKAKGLTFNGE